MTKKTIHIPAQTITAEIDPDSGDYRLTNEEGVSRYWYWGDDDRDFFNATVTIEDGYPVNTLLRGRGLPTLFLTRDETQWRDIHTGAIYDLDEIHPAHYTVIYEPGVN